MNAIPSPLPGRPPAPCPPPRTAGLEGLCYDCSQCVSHTYLVANPPVGCPYKGVSFPKVKSEPCTQVLSRHLSGKIKTACLPVLVLCAGYDCRGRCLRCPFPFLLISCFFFHCCREIPTHGLCKAWVDAAGCSLVCLHIGGVEILYCRCKETKINKHYFHWF